MKTQFRVFHTLALLVPCAAAFASTQTSFNPDISLILDGRYASSSNDSEYELPGFMLGGEAGRGEEGFFLGHNELIFSASIDDLFYGKLTTALAEHEGATEVELEEAYIEAPALGEGFALKAGRFYSAIAYLNQQHGHAWDFADAPLVYRALFGDQLVDDGLQLSWLAPTDTYLRLGVEALRGERFPAGGAANNGNGAFTYFMQLGGDVGISHAWQLSLSHYSADIEERVTGAHQHDDGAAEVPAFTGNSDINALSIVWKWAPDGNSRQTNLKLQAEYFQRDEDGQVTLQGSDPLETTRYLGEQSGYYLQAVYQFMPRWRVGYRYDYLESDNTGDDADVLDEVGLASSGFTPERSSVMLDYSRSEYSRLRLQYTVDDSYDDSDQRFVLQYIVSLGAHGAHQF